jgi:hypothetical protein
MIGRKITVRKDGPLWRVDCPHGDIPPRKRFWALHSFALRSAIYHPRICRGPG